MGGCQVKEMSYLKVTEFLCLLCVYSSVLSVFIWNFLPVFAGERDTPYLRDPVPVLSGL